MASVAALGELLIDFACIDVNSVGYPVMSANPGGAPANYLAALSKFGVSASFIGKVGGDSFGDRLIETLRLAGIETSGIVRDESVFTTLAFVTFDETGNREFSFARKPGADTQLRFEEVDLSIIDAADVVHFGSLSLTDEPARSTTFRVIHYAKDCGKIISYDPNYRAPLWQDEQSARSRMLEGLRYADVVKISDEEIAFLFSVSPEEGADIILNDFGASIVFVTLGKDGCYFSNGSDCGCVAGLSGIRAVDTTGAGDIFGGSAMYKILSTGKALKDISAAELRGIAEFAVTASGLSVTKQGGIPSIPSLEEVLTA